MSWHDVPVSESTSIRAQVRPTERTVLAGAQPLRSTCYPIEHPRRTGLRIPAHLWVGAQIDEHIEECFACYVFPPSHPQRIRSTKGWERLMQETSGGPR